MTSPGEAAPAISVVTPFYNTAPYLAECIESVLAQTFGDFEYLLVDNRSTDGSHEIAARYAARDARIRLVVNEAFVGQVENYNGALARVSPAARWVKLVQADDALYPECLARMLEAGERDPRIGLVSSFYLKGDVPAGAGVPRGVARLDGRAACRLMLLEKRFFVGSPTAVLYRADLVRARRPFYTPGRYHEDTEAAYELLLEHDLGFVHQVLTFLRTEAGSIMGKVASFNPGHLDYLILIERYGRAVLSPEEFERLGAAEWRSYLAFLGSALLRGRERAFWDYHRGGLATIGRTLRRRDVVINALRAAARLALNPLDTVERVLPARRSRLGGR